MEQKGAGAYEKKSARMSEKISKQVQDAIDGIMRNDPTMTSVDLQSEWSKEVDLVWFIEIRGGCGAWVAIVLLVSLLKLRHHQITPWAMLELLRLLLRWRRTAACRR